MLYISTNALGKHFLSLTKFSNDFLTFKLRKDMRTLLLEKSPIQNIIPFEQKIGDAIKDRQKNRLNQIIENIMFSGV